MMKKFIKDNWIFLLLVLLGGLIGGYALGLYSYDTLSSEYLKMLQEQNVTRKMVALSTMFQYSIPFGIVLASLGIILAKKVGLWKKITFNKKAIFITAIISLISALILFPGDKLIFGSFSSWVSDQYTIVPTISKIIGGLLVGGIIEEVMMRLFLMSLFVFIGRKLFYKNKKEIPLKVYVIANILSAILFAAGHLPSTSTMTDLTIVIVIRCFLFNGGLGLCFGYLYRKYGIAYSMIAHGLAHLLSDILMILFI